MNASISTIRFGRLAASAFTRDIQKAHAFYRDVLGFTKSFENGSPVGFMILQKDDAELHLSLVKGHTPSTTNIASLLVDNVDALHDVLVAAGVRIIKSLADKDYGLRAFVFADPDGNRIDVGQPTEGGALRRFEDRNLTGAGFANCRLAGAAFDDVDLSDASFGNVNLRGARLTNVNLGGVSIDDCRLAGAVFDDVDLSQASFRNVDLSGVSIDDANIEGLTIFGIDIQALVQAELTRRGGG